MSKTVFAVWTHWQGGNFGLHVAGVHEVDRAKVEAGLLGDDIKVFDTREAAEEYAAGYNRRASANWHKYVLNDG